MSTPNMVEFPEREALFNGADALEAEEATVSFNEYLARCVAQADTIPAPPLFDVNDDLPY